jgi:hypothetical protein
LPRRRRRTKLSGLGSRPCMHPLSAAAGSSWRGCDRRALDRLRGGPDLAGGAHRHVAGGRPLEQEPGHLGAPRARTTRRSCHLTHQVERLRFTRLTSTRGSPSPFPLAHRALRSHATSASLTVSIGVSDEVTISFQTLRLDALRSNPAVVPRWSSAEVRRP